jgi:probable F420-dependent oxidoreductase
MAMRLGFGLPVSGSWAVPGTMLHVARRAEELGYGSLWTFQRLLHPADGDWGPMYRSVQDPLVTLAYVAAHTERARLGVAVVNAPFYPPVLLAKQLTTLDVVSGGRLDVGLGLGWADEEFTAVGVPARQRAGRTEEAVACLRAVWGKDPVSFAGRYYEVPPSQVDPKPVQQPHPPLLLGGAAEPALRRVGRLADGWISASRHDLTRVDEALSVIRGSAEDAGRDPAELRFVIRGVVHLDDELRNRDGVRRPLTGTEGQIREDLAKLAALGVTEVFLDLNFNPSVGSPDADPAASLETAERVLETFAPDEGTSR